MRVLQINSVCGVGSTGRLVTDIHHILLETGYESYIAYGRGEALGCDNAIKIGDNFAHLAHLASTRLFDRHGFGSKKATERFIQEVELLDPDIIHLHNIHGYYVNIEILFEYLKRVDKPIIWTLHDCWAFTGHCAYFDFACCNKWQEGCNDCPDKREYPKSAFLDLSSKNYFDKKRIFTGIRNLTIISPSEWLASLVRKSYLKEYPVRVINNGIDFEVFKPSKSNFRVENNIVDKFILLGVTNVWDRRKGLEYFIKLASHLDSDEIIILVGLTKQQNEGLPKNVIGICRTNNVQELVEIYSVSDIFINLTLEDNFPSTNLEALACGLPIITFDTGGSVESVSKETGYIVEKGNIDGIYERVKTLRSFPSRAEIIRATARKEYDKKYNYLKYLEIYKTQGGEK